MPPNMPPLTSVLTPAMAVVVLLNLIVGALTALSAHGSLGPIKAPPSVAAWLPPALAILSGAVTFITTQAADPLFHFTAMLIVTAILAGLGNWIASALAGQAVAHHLTMRAMAHVTRGGTPGPMVASLVRMTTNTLGVLALAAALAGCLGSKLPSDVQRVEECVMGQIEAGNTDAVKILESCGPMAIDIIAAWLQSGDFKSQHAAAVAPLSTSLPLARARLASGAAP